MRESCTLDRHLELGAYKHIIDGRDYDYASRVGKKEKRKNVISSKFGQVRVDQRRDKPTEDDNIQAFLCGLGQGCMAGEVCCSKRPSRDNMWSCHPEGR